MSLNMEKQTLEKHYSSSHAFLKKKKTLNLVSLYLKPKLSLNLSHFQPSFSKRTSPLSSSQILLIKPSIILKQQLMHQHQLKIKRKKKPWNFCIWFYSLLTSKQGKITVILLPLMSTTQPYKFHNLVTSLWASK